MIRLVWLLAPKLLMTAPVSAWADLTVQVDAQKVAIVNVQTGRYDKPTALPRYRGRFLARAMKGNQILEEYQLELPLLADAETDDASDEARKFAERLRNGVSVKAKVRVPLPQGADSIVFVDGKNGRSARVSLVKAPPSPPPQGASANAPPGR